MNCLALVEVEYQGTPAHAAVSCPAPLTRNVPQLTANSIIGLTTQGFPEQGVNALDAAVSAYQSVSLLRQQTPDKSRIHGVIRGSEEWSTNGEYNLLVGVRPLDLTGTLVHIKVIPSSSKIQFGIRSPTAKETLILLQKVLNCFKAAALATGCTHTIRTEMRYLDLRNADIMEDYWSEVSESVCETKVQRGGFAGGSTDFVSGKVCFFA
jgi:metal-dependent amidase/aminoacylase/carboxypeptidase family protein